MLQTQTAFPQLSKNKIFILIAVTVVAVVMGLAGIVDPLYLVIGVAAFYLTLAFLKWPDIAVIFVSFIIYTNTAVVLTKFHGVPAFVGYILPLLLVIPFIWQIVVNNQKIKFGPVFFLMVVYFSVILVGSAFSRDVNLAMPSLINFISEGLILYFLIINTVRTPKLLNRIVWTLLIAGGLMGALSLYQQITGTFDNPYGGYAQVTGAAFTTGETLQGTITQPRVSGPVGEKNRYAQIMLMLVPLGLFRAWGEKSTKLRVAAFVLTALAFIGGSLAFSRGAQVGFLLLIGVMVFMRYIKIHQVLILLLGILLLLLAFPQNSVRFSTLSAIFSSEDEGGIRSADGAIRGRATEMLVAWYVFLDHPIVGVGPGMIGYEMEDYSKLIALRNLLTTREAHSLYLGEAAETGALGFISLMTIFFYTLYQLAKSRTYWLDRNQTNMANLCTGFFLAIITYMTTGIFLHMSYIRYFWLFLALAVVASEFREEVSSKELVEKNLVEARLVAEKSS